MSVKRYREDGFGIPYECEDGRYVLASDHDAVVDEMLVSIGKQADRANKAEAALAERDERIAELTEIALARADALAERDRRIAELERALRAISDEAREGYYDGPGLQRFVEIRGLAEDALAPVGGKEQV